MSNSFGSFHFSYTAEDIMQAFAVLDKAKKDPRSNVLTIAMLGLIVYSLSIMTTSYALFGIIMEIIGIYVIFRVKTAPMLERKKTAKMMTKESKTFLATVGQQGIQITEKQIIFSIPYEKMVVYSTPELLLLVSEGNLIVIPKRYMGNEEKIIVAKVKSSCKERFTQL